ncbi:MAG: hypothetical protein ACD_3C00225G0001 [uncultured bacterium (gcode 4)]|uniref:Uncharacterized protein n=1 Tax=uncultured bacterium (gcode 4) TaxID=1234023 RepID=K2FWC9_9BACT|nr:MAG: hypothetical protein ACD_3C00225G0001 [uncultured bacterium (gcode 4)]
MINSVLLNEGNIFRIQLLPQSNIRAIKKKISMLSRNEEFSHKSFIEDDSFKLLGMKSEFIMGIFEKYFKKAEYIENKLFYEITEKIKDVVAYKINDESEIMVFIWEWGIIKNIYFSLYLSTEKEKKKLMEAFREINEEYKLVFVDWDLQFFSELKDCDNVEWYFDENLKMFSWYYEEIDKSHTYKRLSMFKCVINTAIPTLFILVLLFNIFFNLSKDLIKVANPVITWLFFSVSVILILSYFFFYRWFLKWLELTRYGLKLKRFWREEFYEIENIKSVGVAFSCIYINVSTVNGLKKIYLNFVFINDALRAVYAVRRKFNCVKPFEENEKIVYSINKDKWWKKYSKKYSNKTFIILHYIDFYSQREIKIAPWRYFFMKLKLINPNPAYLFMAEFGWIKWYHLWYNTNIWTEYYIFDSLKNKKTKKQIDPDYSDLVWESLTPVWRAWNYKYTIYISDSGKLYCSYIKWLFLYWNDYYEWLDNLLTWKHPLEIIDVTKDNDILDYADKKWSIIYWPQHFLASIYANILSDSDEIFGNNLLPLLVDKDEKEFVVYDLDDSCNYYIRNTSVEDENSAVIVKLDSKEQTKKFLSPACYEFRLIFSREYCDSIVRDVISVLKFNLTNDEVAKIMASEDNENVCHFRTEKPENDNYFAIDKSNKDWNFLYVRCVSDKLRDMDNIIDKYLELNKEKYWISYDNFNEYFKKYPTSFFRPLANLNFIDRYILEFKNKEQSENLSQYTITLDHRYFHEIALDIWSIFGVPVDLDYVRKVYENDWLLWINCLGIFNMMQNTWEFMLFDCQNVDKSYWLIVRCLHDKSEIIKQRLLEWQNHLRDLRWELIELKEIPNDINEVDNYLNRILLDYKLDLDDIINNNPDEQFIHLNSLSYKARLFLKDKLNI